MNISDAKNAVRLSAVEITAIQESVRALLGDDASVYLFGSRARKPIHEIARQTGVKL